MPAHNRRYALFVLKLLIVLIIAAAFAAYWNVMTMPERADTQQTLVLGPDRLAPASDAGLRVVVQEAGSGRPVDDAVVNVTLQPSAGGQPLQLFQGVTDESGSLPLVFSVPAEAEGDYRLVVETESRAGADRIERPVMVERAYRLLLATDKPLYQPGQTVHMRALALNRFDLTPAEGETVEFLVQDAKGNKVFRQSVPASGFGIAAADFILADMVNQGNYTLSAAMGQTTSEKTVEVRPYVLPKFGVAVSTGQTFYTPGQRVEGSIQADYFFGKPVAQAEVRLAGVVYDVERVELVNLAGQTDAGGRYDFSFDLPDYFAGSGLDSQQARFALEVTVIDQTDHPEQTSAMLPVAAQPIVIEAVAESGTLRPGVENIVYILTAYPDGTPAKTKLKVSINQGQPQPLTSSDYGLAELRLTPTGTSVNLDIQASDERGFSAARYVPLEAEGGSDQVLLRADRAAYVVGETMQLTALTPVNAGSIYLDIVKEGQTLSTRSAPVQGGRADFAVDVSPDLYGTLELHAYKVLLDGSMVRDTRLVVVDEPRDLAIAISADKDTYRPGDPATIDFQTTFETDGSPAPAALGLAVVDESVYALQQQDPGFAKLYFLLEAELLEPFYQVEGFTLPAAYTPDQAGLRQAQDTSTRAAWAEVPASGLAMQVNSRPEKMEALREAQEEGLWQLMTAAIYGMALVPLLLWLVVLLALGRSGRLKRSLVGLVKASGILVVVILALYGLLMLVQDSRYGRWYDLEEWLALGLAGLFGLALLGLGGYAWRRRDETAKFMFLLSAGWIGLLALLVMASDHGPSPDERAAMPALLSLVLAPGAYLLLGQKLWAEKRGFPGWLATVLGSVTVLPALLAPIFFLETATLTGRAVIMEEPVAAMALEMAAPMEGAGMPRGDADGAVAGEAAAAEKTTTPGEAPRLRQFFPETLYWNPEVLTDEAGQARVEIPMADSITTWRLTALASSQDGRLGFTTQGLRVFQDFFVDIDLPVSLTEGDEISIPVGVFNYLPETQEVRLVVEPEPWFELLGPAEQTLTIASNDIDVVYFPIRVANFGRNGFQVTAWGEKMSDAIRREVRVMPNGQEVRLTESNWLRESKEVALNLPPGIVPRTGHVEVKIYTGVLAQVVEGLEKILRLPHG